MTELTYSWDIKSIKKTDIGKASNILCHVTWEYSGTDSDGNTGTFQGATPLDTSSIDPKKITPYENLTKEDVIKWIAAIVDNDVNYKNHINEQILAKINENKNYNTSSYASTNDHFCPTTMAEMFGRNNQ